MTHHDHKESGCCGSEKHPSHAQPEKEKEGCCGSGKDKKPETDKAEKPKTQGGGCCGGGTK